MHIIVEKEEDIIPTIDRVKSALHRFGVHSSSIQPELNSDPSGSHIGGKATRMRHLEVRVLFYFYFYF